LVENGAEIMPNQVQRRHLFFAEASFVTGLVDSGGGVQQPIPEQGFLHLPVYGGLEASPHTAFSLAPVVSVGTGYTSVQGIKTAAGWREVALAVAQNVDIAGVVTADEVTAKITLDFPAQGYVPTIDFTGTSFTNLAINGTPVNPTLNLNMCAKPAGDIHYTNDPGLIARTQQEYAKVSGDASAPDFLRNEFKFDPKTIQSTDKLDCSLVTGVTGLPRGQAFGNVICVPPYVIYLAEVCISTHYELTMIRLVKQPTQTEIRLSNCNGQGHTIP
jgi:hypothetical protein